MNVYYQDEEMRKQASMYEDAPVVTAQEKPEGSNQVFRLHLFKLHMAADPTAQRDLFNRITRMIELIGFKRFELNAMIVFAGVCQDNFFSLLRRSHVTVYKCKVLDKHYIDAHIGPNAASKGVFPRDPFLKKKLGMPAAAAVLLKMLRAYMTNNNSESCCQTIEDYVQNGGDDGVTKDTMLKACGLQPALPPQNKLPGNPIDEPVSVDAPPQQEPMLREAKIVIQYMLDFNMDRVTGVDVTKLTFDFLRWYAGLAC